MNQRGIADGWLILIVLAALSAAAWWAYQTVDQRGYERGRLEVQARFDQYKHEVSELGAKAQARADAEKARSAAISQKRESSYEKRIADIADAYRRLRDQSGSGPVSAIPEASIRAADPASDNRLLEALRAADEQTARLIELQTWVREQMK